MKFLKLLIVTSVVPLLAITSTTTVFAECNNSGYGSSNCSDNNKDYEVEKKVTKSGETSRQEKITNIKKGDNFTFSFKITNNSNEEVTFKLVDNLPSEFEKVSGIGFTEEVKVGKNSSKTLEMVAKVKDSEFDGKKDFEKCVINKAYIYKGDSQKDSSTSTVCYGNGATITSLPKTGTSEIILGVSILTTALGFGLSKFRR